MFIPPPTGVQVTALLKDVTDAEGILTAAQTAADNARVIYIRAVLQRAFPDANTAVVGRALYEEVFSLKEIRTPFSSTTPRVSMRLDDKTVLQSLAPAQRHAVALSNHGLYVLGKSENFLNHLDGNEEVDIQDPSGNELLWVSLINLERSVSTAPGESL